MTLPIILSELERLSELEVGHKAEKARVAKVVGAKFRSHRLSLNLSLRAMAVKTGCSANFLCDLENGERFPSEKWVTIILSVNKDQLTSTTGCRIGRVQ